MQADVLLCFCSDEAEEEGEETEEHITYTITSEVGFANNKMNW